MTEYRTPTYPLDLPTFLDLKKRETMIDLKVAKLGTIVSYDSSNDTATVKIMSKFNEKTPNVWDYMEIKNVPVVKSKYFSHPVKQGDGCLLIFLDTDFSWWLDKGQTEVPLSPRLHNLNDAIAIMGVDTIGERPNFGNDNTNTLIDAGSGKIGIKNSQIDVINLIQSLCNMLTKVDTALSSLYGSPVITNDILAFKTDLQKLIKGTLV